VKMCLTLRDHYMYRERERERERDFFRNFWGLAQEFFGFGLKNP
jgi:hypothetical protein